MTINWCPVRQAVNVCRMCNRTYACEDMRNARDCKHGHERLCRFCHSERETKRNASDEGKERRRNWRRANPDRVKGYKLAESYGISFEEYAQMVREQGSRCAICNRETSLVVDHDHATGKIRKLLCAGCNKGLGFFNEDPESLRRAIKYLEEVAA